MESVWKWDQSLETGVEEIDRQHKELLERGNQLAFALSSDSKVEALTGMLEFLSNYVLEHFSAEEKLQQEYHYPAYEAHKAIHDNFIKDLTQIKEEMQLEGVTPGISLSITRTLYEWLVEHIGIQDKALAEFLKNL